MTISALPVERRGSGVRVSAETLHSYDLTVVAADVDGVVTSAGGWLCDRARAGWQVTVLVPVGHDVCALTILGLHVEEVTSPVDVLRGLSCAAVAVDARVLHRDEHVRREVLRMADDTRTEVTVWGETAQFCSGGRFERVRHRLSAASRAYKSRAVRTNGLPHADLCAEEFVSVALWYPPDGADLVPVAGP
jgi:hypothetical protein